jgi:hypothetical protein
MVAHQAPIDVSRVATTEDPTNHSAAWARLSGHTEIAELITTHLET